MNIDIDLGVLEAQLDELLQRHGLRELLKVTTASRTGQVMITGQLRPYNADSKAEMELYRSAQPVSKEEERL